MATRVLVAVVRGGELEGDFADLGGVDLHKDVGAFKAHFKESRGAYLLGIEPWLMTVFGPWDSAEEVPDDMAVATHGRGRSPLTTLGTLVVGKPLAFFLVRITTPPVATGESGVELARHALSVPTILVVREIRPSVCTSCIPTHARQPLHHCTCTRVSYPSPLSRFAGIAVGGAGLDVVAPAGGAGGAGE
jgi:hypothetical protein